MNSNPAAKPSDGGAFTKEEFEELQFLRTFPTEVLCYVDCLLGPGTILEYDILLAVF